MVQRSWISGLSLALVPLVMIACGDDDSSKPDKDTTSATTADPDATSGTTADTSEPTEEDTSATTTTAPDTTVEEDTTAPDTTVGEDTTEADTTEPDTSEPPEYVYDPVPGHFNTAYDFTQPGLQAPLGPRAYAMVKNATTGDVYVGGIFDHAGPLEVQNVAHWTAGGGFTAMGDGLDMTVHTLALDDAGHVYAAGRGPDGFIGGPGTISEWDGAAWTSLGMYDQFTPVWTSLWMNGELIIGGEFGAINAPDFSGSTEAMYLAKWNGTEWAAFDDEPDGPIHALAVHNGELCIGGNFSKVGEVAAQNIACLGASGWYQVGNGLNSEVHVIYDEAGESLMAGGYFSFGDPAGPANQFFVGLGRYTAGDDDWRAVAGGVIDGFITNVRTIVPAGDDGLFIGGNFAAVNAVSPVVATNIATLNGNSWSDIGGLRNELGITLGSEVGPTAIVPDGEGFLVAGLFSNAGDTSALNIARYEKGTWLPLVEVTGPNLGVPGFIDHMAFGPDAALYISGGFSSAGGVTTPNIAKLVFPDVPHIIPHPTPSPEWHSLGDGIEGNVRVVLPARNGKVYAGGEFFGSFGIYDDPADDGEWVFPGEFDNTVNELVEGPEGDANIYIGGDFTSIGQVDAMHIARWTGSTFQPFGVGLDDRVNAILVGPSGEVYAGGFFQGTGDYSEEDGTGLALNRLAKWSGSGWEDVGGGVQSDSFGFITDLAWYDGKLLVVGQFDVAGDQTISSIATYDGSEWKPLGAPELFRYSFDAPLPLGKVAVQPNGFFLTGLIDVTVDGQQFNHIAWWNGTAWETLGDGFNDVTQTAAIAPDGRSVFIGGAFLTAGGQPSLSLGHWVYDDQTGTIVEP